MMFSHRRMDESFHSLTDMCADVKYRCRSVAARMKVFCYSDCDAHWEWTVMLARKEEGKRPVDRYVFDLNNGLANEWEMKMQLKFESEIRCLFSNNRSFHPSSAKSHFPGRGFRNPYMTVYGCKRSANGTYPTAFRRITWLRITIVFLRVVYEGIQVVYDRKRSQ